MDAIRQRLMMQSAGGLPEIYQQVEYLQSHGAEYLDLDFTMNLSYDGAELKYQTEIGQLFFCGDFENSSRQFYFANQGRRTSNVGYSRIRHYTTDYYSSSQNCNDGIAHIFTYDAEGVFKVDGVVEYDSIARTDQHTLNTLLLFMANRETGIKYPMKIYYYQHFRNGSLYADLVPCYRKADNVAGMYDLKRRRFFINAGTGTFDVGPNVQTY